MPKRYLYTTAGRCSLSPWIANEYTYSIMQLYLGSNPLSKIEIVFQLNLLSHAIEMYSYSDTRPSKYNPKIYFGSTLQTISTLWIGDKNYRSSTTPNHDEVKTQKQVRNLKIYNSPTPTSK